MIVYDVHNFPALSKLVDSTLLDTFIEEANKVHSQLPINANINRKREQWDNASETMPLLNTIIENNNSSWIVCQNNERWLNYPLMYYDKVVPGMSEQLCPNILSFLKSLKHVRIAGLSLLKQGAIIPPHTDSTGRTNDSLACHICLTGTGNLYLQGDTIQQYPKHVFAFDSEYEHSAQCTSREDRIILFIDFQFSKHAISVTFHTKQPRSRPIARSIFRNVFK